MKKLFVAGFDPPSTTSDSRSLTAAPHITWFVDEIYRIMDLRRIYSFTLADFFRLFFKI
jgi:hypothetical protein